MEDVDDYNGYLVPKQLPFEPAFDDFDDEAESWWSFIWEMPKKVPGAIKWALAVVVNAFKQAPEIVERTLGAIFSALNSVLNFCAGIINMFSNDSNNFHDKILGKIFGVVVLCFILAFAFLLLFSLYLYWKLGDRLPQLIEQLEAKQAVEGRTVLYCQTCPRTYVTQYWFNRHQIICPNRA